MKEKKLIDLGDIDEKFFQDEDSSQLKDNRVVIADDKEVLPFKSVEKFPFETQDVRLPEPGLPNAGEKISSLEDKMTQIDSAIANVRRTNEETEEKLSKIEKSLEGMLSVYELVTNEANPFLEGREVKETAEVKSDKIAKPVGEICLTKISNEPSFVMLVLKWLDFLLKKAGYMGMVKVLLYYEDLGWISEAVRSRMVKYSRDLGADKRYTKEKRLSVKDHIVSLYFIAKLQGIKIDASLYSDVIGELDGLGMLD